MVLHEALEERRGLLDDVAVVAGPRPEQRRLERTEVTDPFRTTELVDEHLVEGEDLGEREVDGVAHRRVTSAARPSATRHCARRR
jgi:hypothetical protein